MPQGLSPVLQKSKCPRVRAEDSFGPQGRWRFAHLPGRSRPGTSSVPKGRSLQTEPGVFNPWAFCSPLSVIEPPP